MHNSGVGRVSTAGGGGAGHPRSENENEARSWHHSTVTQSQLPFSLVAAFDGSEPKIEAEPFETGLEMYKYVAIPFDLIILLRQVKFMYNDGALVVIAGTVLTMCSANLKE